MSRRIRILAVCPDPRDGTAWYRAVSPFGRLQETRDDIELSVTKLDVTHADISRHDVLFLQRPVAPEHAHMVKVAKSFGLSVWSDWDDPYFNVPLTNPRYFVYAQPEVKQAVADVASLSDVITVSSLQLQVDFKKVNPRTALLPNGLDESITVPEQRTDELPVRRVLWRGGDSHTEDLQKYTEAIVGAANSDAPHHIWSFWGVTPHWLMPRIPYGAAQVVGWCQFQDYFRMLPTLRPNIVIVPLHETHFNKCKSNIAAMEGAWAGAAVLAPRWPEWYMPGVTTYDSPASFQKQLEKLLKTSTQELRNKSAETLAHVREHMSVDVVNRLRSRILDSLLASHTPKWKMSNPVPAREQAQTPSADELKDASSVGASPTAGSPLQHQTVASEAPRLSLVTSPRDGVEEPVTPEKDEATGASRGPASRAFDPEVTPI